jgi:AcrR family transcriptional regulator
VGRPRAGSRDAREEILDGALRVFAREGYDRATVRGIAKEAKVDPALVYHYFEGKAELYVTAVKRAMQPAPRATVPPDESISDNATRLVRTFFERWTDDDGATPFLALIRSAMSDETAAGLLREAFGREIVPHVASKLGKKDAELRVALVGAQLLGLGIVRYVLRLSPVAEASLDDLARQMGPLVETALRASSTRSKP